jgi:alkanesulfonate monooxygenase SsuD/methylene tetrahydromethanopterin reductase-like flavin-dependent oxidoreductase (luciferase family)
MGGISPIVLSWIARDQKRARIKALKDAADSAGRDPHQAHDMRVRARLREAKAELERLDALRVSRF